jgi:hypothetical protein
MTKIGKGEKPPREPNLHTYQHALEKYASKFLNALDHYEVASTPEDRARLKADMDESLGLMRSAAQEIPTHGIRKQEHAIENAYKTYLGNKTPDNLAALCEDLAAFRDNNRFP